MKFITTPIAVSVHRADESPIFGEGATHIKVKDEAGGPFIELVQHNPDATVLRFDIEELELVAAEARKLIDAQPNQS